MADQISWSLKLDPCSWDVEPPLMTIERTGDQLDEVKLKADAFDITIKDGWLTAKPKALKPPETP